MSTAVGPDDQELFLPITVGENKLICHTDDKLICHRRNHLFELDL